MKKVIVGIIIAILCVIAICINHFFEEYKALGYICVAIVGILGIVGWKHK